MATASYYRTTTSPVRGAYLVPYGSGQYLICSAGSDSPNDIYVGDTTSLQAYTIYGTDPSAITMTADTDGGTGAYLLKSKAELLSISGSTPVSGSPYQLSSNVILEGLRTVGTQPYVTDTSNNFYTTQSGALTGVTLSGASGLTASWLRNFATDGSLLYVADTTGTFNSITFSSTVSGTWGTAVSTPFTAGALSIVHTSSGLVMAGKIADTLSMATSGMRSINSQLIFADSANTQFSAYSQNADGTWSSAQTLSTSAAPTYLEAQNIYAFVSEPSINNVEVFENIGGVWSHNANLSATNAGKVAADSKGTTVLVCEPSANTVEEFQYSGSSWASSGTLAVTNPTDVVIASTTRAYVAGGSTVTILLGS